MKNLIFPVLLLTTIFFFASCDGEEIVPTLIYDYHVHIHSPNTDAKMVGDTMHLHVEFESHTGETVHHVNVRIYNKDDNTEIYNMPTEAHVHELSGNYAWHDDFVLSEANGVMPHTDWVLEAKVWGHEDAVEEVMETVEFHVHPQ